jgi:uncharacterized protein
VRFYFSVNEQEGLMNTTTRRRYLVGALAASGAAFTATIGAAAPEKLDLTTVRKETDIACLYHCDFGDPARFAQLLNNVNNHLAVYNYDTSKVKIVIVTHSAGIKFFLHDLARTPWEKERVETELYNRFIELAKHGVEAYLCQITYTRLKVDPSHTRDHSSLKFVPSGVATVAELQSKGFAYLKVG